MKINTRFIVSALCQQVYLAAINKTFKPPLFISFEVEYFLSMDQFQWSDDVLQFLLNEITDPKYLLSWAATNQVLSHDLVIRRIQELNGQKVSV